VYFWYDTGEQGYFDVRNACAVAIKQTLDEAGIEMPFPTRTVILQKE
jgi:small-conductance mechanosensitive channel